MVYEDESSNDLSSLDISSSSDDMMYRIPAIIDDKDYMGIENSALDVCLEHGLPLERRVAFEGFETGRRFLVCAQPHHVKIIHVKDDKVKPEANQWKTNDVQEGTTNGVQEGSGVISDDPEYNPKEDEVVVHKIVKALKTASKKRKSSEASAAMPP
ncbi:hypothetical protein D1007_12971 [Hordeum vulgare]|nr:hypothetical protein D1007_12971 [Hordeum vulgare]